VIDLKIEGTETTKRLKGPRSAVHLALPIETEILGHDPEPSGEGCGSRRLEAKQPAKTVFGEFLTDEYETVGSFFLVARGNSRDVIQSASKLKQEVLPCFLCLRGTQAVQEGGSFAMGAFRCDRGFRIRHGEFAQFSAPALCRN
jgi:hypothetical protein